MCSHAAVKLKTLCAGTTGEAAFRASHMLHLGMGQTLPSEQKGARRKGWPPGGSPRCQKTAGQARGLQMCPRAAPWPARPHPAGPAARCEGSSCAPAPSARWSLHARTLHTMTCFTIVRSPPCSTRQCFISLLQLCTTVSWYIYHQWYKGPFIIMSVASKALLQLSGNNNTAPHASKGGTCGEE